MDIDYYPSTKHVAKGWAPEREISKTDFAALAMASQRAVREGVLSKDLANRMIPMAMVEGWSNNYGVRQDLRLYASPQNIERFRKMGLTVRDAEEENVKMVRGEFKPEPPRELSFMEKVRAKIQRGGMELLDAIEQRSRDPNKQRSDAQIEWDKAMQMYRKDEHQDKIEAQLEHFTKVRDGQWQKMPGAEPFESADLVVTTLPGKGKDKFIVLNGSPDNRTPLKNAYLMAGVMGEKASHADIATVQDAVKRYNGRGRGMERLEGEEFVPADVEVYSSKVEDARRMIDHPSNAHLKSFLEDVGYIPNAEQPDQTAALPAVPEEEETAQ